MNDIISKTHSKQVRASYKGLKEAGYFDKGKTTLDKWRMYQDSDTVNADRKVVGNYINKYMKKHMNEVLKTNASNGYDAIVDPEDTIWNYDMPLILINDKKFKEIKREKISKDEEEKWKYKN